MSHRYNPAILARHVYDKEPCARTWAEDVELHLLFGYVFSTPDYFIMGRPVKHDAPDSCIVDPLYQFPRCEWDAWHIYLYSGDITKCWDIEPFKFPWVTFERKNVLRRYPMDRLKRLIRKRLDLNI